MEKRVLIAIFLSFIVLYVYQALVVKPVPKGAKAPGSPAATQQSATTTPGADAAAPTGQTPQPPPAPSADAIVGERGERDITIETPTVVAVFTNRGARLKSWRLKRYLDAKREPLELVVRDLPAAPLPFSLGVSGDDATTTTLNGALYTAAESGNDLRFEYRDTSGLHVVKDVHFEDSPYIVTLRVEAARGDTAIHPTIQWGPALGDVSEVSRFTKRPEALLSASGANGKAQRIQAKDLTKQPTYTGDYAYAGVDDQYFLTATLFTGPNAVLVYQPQAIPPPPGSKEQPREVISWAIDETASATRPVRFFIGPKDLDVLKAVDPNFVYAIDFGWFAIIVVPLLQSLKWINGYVGNYGTSIILLTIVINAIMFPLRHKSVVAMRKMQEIQPEVKAIQDRYAKYKATDPAKQKMNQELMALYRDRGVNPAGGCVPMLLTIPLVYAFYSLLSTSIELRGAPFFGWIHDLSVHDPYYVTPILMGISQFWQTRITPAAGADPAQQKTMMMMPVVFTVLFLWAPAGVAIYWLVSNLWGIGQQYLTNYLIGPPKIKPAPTPGGRPAKRGTSQPGAAPMTAKDKA